MYRKRISVLATILIASSAALSILSAPVTSAATKPKAAGRTTTIAPNTILNGKGTPLSSKGIDGDFYIDTRSLQIYGPKKSGKWPVPQSLQGPVGANGTDGKNGNEGKTISAASTVVGPTGTQGLQGSQGLQGEKGERGEGGSPGANGSSGPAGPAGATGPQGPSGGGGGGSVGPAGANGANGATGATGLTGAKGETGTVGSIGVTGLKGETGTVGATGPSNVYTGTFTIPDISGGVGTSQTASIGTFTAGKKYLVTLSIITYQPTRNMNNSLPMGLAISNNVGTPTVGFVYQTFQGISYRSGSGSMRYEYVVDAQISIDATTSIDSSINIQLTIGYDTTTHLARSEGTYVATLVGSIGAL